MEKLKKPSELIEPDQRNLAFVTLDADTSEGLRPPTLEDRYIEMEVLELPPEIPEHVASAFAVARNLWMYGWFHWPFYALAGFHAYRCMEVALRHRERAEIREGRLRPVGKRGRSLAQLLTLAAEERWIEDGGFGQFRRREAARERETEIFGHSDEESANAAEPSSNEFSRMLAQRIPRMRNFHAHADAPTALMY